MHLPSPVTAEHVAFASAHLLELETAHASAVKRNEARRRWKALARRWRLQRMAGLRIGGTTAAREGLRP
jgi:hypothetical protein